MSNQYQVINTGSIQAPYKEFSYTIKSGQSQIVDYPTDNFNLLYVSQQNAIEVRFGGQSESTSFTQGMQYRLDEPVGRTVIFNTSDADVECRVALGIGLIQDNRLNLSSGTLAVVEVRKAPEIARTTLDASGVFTIPNTGTKVIIQNVSSSNLFIFADDGFEIYPSGTIDVNISGNFAVYGQEGQTFVYGVFENV